MTSNSENKDSNNNGSEMSGATADFVCFVCGAVFTTDEDRRAHLKREVHGELHDETTSAEKRKAAEQERLNEERTHYI